MPRRTRVYVLDYCPLQQGLRLLCLCARFALFAVVLDYCPLQQGLRLLFELCVLLKFAKVLDYCPLQQGLRHIDRALGSNLELY